jgi:hypothetical protein
VKGNMPKTKPRRAPLPNYPGATAPLTPDVVLQVLASASVPLHLHEVCRLVGQALGMADWNFPAESTIRQRLEYLHDRKKAVRTIKHGGGSIHTKWMTPATAKRLEKEVVARARRKRSQQANVRRLLRAASKRYRLQIKPKDVRNVYVTDYDRTGSYDADNIPVVILLALAKAARLRY